MLQLSMSTEASCGQKTGTAIQILFWMVWIYRYIGITLSDYRIPQRADVCKRDAVQINQMMLVH